MPFSERRKEARIPLDSLYFIHISFNNAEGEKETLTCMVLDVSAGGFMVALPPAVETTPPEIGVPVLIEDIPSELSEFLPQTTMGVIKWTREGLCGLGFAKAVKGVKSLLLPEVLE